MNYRLLVFLSSIAVLIFISCGDTPGNDLEDLETEVMAIHDSVMPQMTKIFYDREKLETWILEDTLSPPSAELKKGISSTIRELKTAEDAMWEWMSNYDDLRVELESQNDSIKLREMEDQKRSIIRVRDLMLSSMAKADSLLALKNEQKD